MRRNKRKLRRVVREEIKRALNEQPETWTVHGIEGGTYQVPSRDIIRIVWSMNGGIGGSTTPEKGLPPNEGNEYLFVVDKNNSVAGDGPFSGGDIIARDFEPPATR